MSLPFIVLFLCLLTATGSAAYFYFKNDKAQKKLKELEAKSTEYQNEEATIHNVVHELRAPLSAIKSSAELMLGKGDSLPVPEKTKMLKLIEDQSKKLLEEVSSILDAGKLEAGKLTMMKLPTDLNVVIKEKLDVFSPSAENKNIALKSQFDTLPLIAFDKHYMSQVINNLLSNSLKFTPEGGQITVVTKNDGKNAIVSVTDTGMGIPKEKQAKLFSRYAQAGNSSIGTGLGLFNVKGIVEAHGGQITLQSEEGHGTTMSFTLPLNAKPDIDTKMSNTKAVQTSAGVVVPQATPAAPQASAAIPQSPSTPVAKPAV